MMITGRNVAACATPLLGQLLLCSFMWASAFLLMKVIGADLAPLPLTAMRGLIGGVALTLLVLAQGQTVLPRGREWRDWVMLGLFQGIIPNTLTVYALTQITTALAAIIQASSPLMVAVLAHLLFSDERLTPRRAGGVLLGFLGMLVLFGPAALGSGQGSVPGILAVIATAASYAVGTVYVRSIPNVQPIRLALGQQLFSGIPATLLVLATTGLASFAAVPDHGPALLVLGLFATALPIVLYLRILRAAGPTRGAMNGYLVPFWTILLGIGLLGETVGPLQVTGGLVVLAGVALVSRTGRPFSRRSGASRDAASG